MEKIIVGIASIKSRERALEKVLISLENQTVKPHQIYVYLNDYSRTPEFARNLKIKTTFFLGLANGNGDKGDAGKFYKVAEEKGYYLSCDDDLEYPVDYIENMLNGIQYYQRKKIISFHGSLLRFPVKNFYRNRKIYHFKHDVSSPIPVHVGGTGVMGFHTDTIKITSDDFKQLNMADIWVALQAQKQKVGIIVAPHPENWIKALPHTVENSIFRSFTASEQRMKIVTNAINSVEKWQLY